MTNNKKIIEKACKLISDNLGIDTANCYKEFYNDKDEKTILASLKELLVEILGEKAAKKQLKNINK